MISATEARQLLGPRGRRLSDEEIRRKCEEAHALARLVYDLFQREHQERTATVEERRSA